MSRPALLSALCCCLLTGCAAPASTPATPTTGEAFAGDECPGGAKWDGERCVPVTVATAPAPTPVPVATQPSAPAAVPTGRGPAMVRIPAGTFMMGSNDGNDNEKPVHQVTVSAFELDVTEVTVAQYRSCVSAGTCEPPESALTQDPDSFFCNYGKAGKDNHPVNYVDWNQATAFCAWAGKRLPTEEEWEYAARGRDGRTYPWGNAAPATQLCWNRLKGLLLTCAVGSYPQGKSPFGLYDMAGNVDEWTSTPGCTYSASGYQSCEDAYRVYRGGAWDTFEPSAVRAASRYEFEPSTRIHNLGFRCARS